MGGRGFESRQKRPKLKDENICILGDASFSHKKFIPDKKGARSSASISRVCPGRVGVSPPRAATRRHLRQTQSTVHTMVHLILPVVCQILQCSAVQIWSNMTRRPPPVLSLNCCHLHSPSVRPSDPTPALPSPNIKRNLFIDKHKPFWIFCI